MSVHDEDRGIDALAQLVAETDDVLAQQRGRTRATFAGAPLVAWGVAWAVGYPALELFPGTTGVVVAMTAVVLASVASWLPHRQMVRTGFEPRVRTGWVIVLVGSYFLVAASGSHTMEQIALLLGGLWALGMALTGVAMRDRGVTLIGCVALVMAGLARMQSLAPPLTLFGIIGGGLLAGLGATRMVAARFPSAEESR